MYDPELYAGANEVQVEDIIQCMNKVKDILPTQHCEVALDVGCGPGDITTSLIPRYLDSDYKMIGCDISEPMVKHAQAIYGNNRISFKLLGISSKDIWADWEKRSFDKILSYFCLHWVSDQRQAAENMYNLLKEDGYIVTTLNTKWPGWRAIIDSNASQEYPKILNKVGFEVMMANMTKREFVHKSKERFLAFLEAIHPFINNIPKEKRKEFISYCKDLLQHIGAIQVNKDGDITHQYTILTTVA